MNEATVSGAFARLVYRFILGARHLAPIRTCAAFGRDHADETIQRIYVINLDRQDERWRQMRRELRRVRHCFGGSLESISRRFSAVDARYYRGIPDPSELHPYYSLGDQLFVEPIPLLGADQEYARELIEMSGQEVAVALSHIAVWRLVAESGMPYVLILEDDVYFCRGFARRLQAVWFELMAWERRGPAFDVLYLSYMEASAPLPRVEVSDRLFEPLNGLWQLSGYVLSAQGARKLLDMLPVRGPVDLWINHQFTDLDVLATRQPIIEQRLDCVSTNFYSVLPVLAKLGVLTCEKPLLFEKRPMPGPVFAFGEQGTGLTPLAMALSMLGYRCCSDIACLPPGEHKKLFSKRHKQVFDAYVNVGSLSTCDYLDLARRYPSARFIVTENEWRPTRHGHGRHSRDQWVRGGNILPSPRWKGLVDALRETSAKVLVLPIGHPDKWELLSGFLGCEYPSNPFPEGEDQAQREPRRTPSGQRQGRPPKVRRLQWDPSPWVVPGEGWSGMPLREVNGSGERSAHRVRLVERFGPLDPTLWELRDDTFPSNLAIFSPDNFSVDAEGIASLTLREERTAVRAYTSASLRSRQTYLYGRFAAELKPPSVSGLVTGMFLHRNSPRQEIDIEFLGNAMTKLLVNVFYNPGTQGAKIEYGYRGTPALIDLHFDASKGFHTYEIQWGVSSIRWLVDGQLLYERPSWGPTPIPHLPMEFNLNLWHSRSKELAGPLARDELPARSAIRRVEIDAQLAPAGRNGI